MSVTQKMFASSGVMFIAVFMFTQAIPVPMPEQSIQPVEYGQVVSAQMVGEPVFVQQSEAMDPSFDIAAVRPVRSASPFFGILGGYEKPHKSHHNYHHEEHEHEPEYHRPQHHKPQYNQHHGGSGAASFASAGSSAGGHGGGHSQSAANSQSASFGFGPFQASYSASSAHSGSHSGGGFSDDQDY